MIVGARRLESHLVANDGEVCGGGDSGAATLHDGSDTVTLVWLGRRRIEGIGVGRRLTVHGRVGRRGSERVLYNPRYELQA